MSQSPKNCHDARQSSLKFRLKLLSGGSKWATSARLLALLMSGAVFTTAGSAVATQPLSTFIEAAEHHSFDAREAAATLEQRKWEVEAARGRLLPSFTARGVLTHNQYATELPPGLFPGQTDPITITPQNQVDATFQLDVPLVDLANYHRYRQAKHLEKATEKSRNVTNEAVQSAVAQAYFTYLGAEALVLASEKTLESAEKNFDFVRTRADLGAATELDRERASANVERAKQDIADANLLRLTAARNLDTLTGLTPSAPTEFSPVDLGPEEPLSTWTETRQSSREDAQAELEKAARAAKKAASYALAPTLSASAQERISNAGGFSGQNASYALSAILTWRLDWGTYGAARAQAAAAEVQSITSERVKRSTVDAIFDSYHRVEAQRIKCAAARAQEASAKKAAALSEERYRAGAVTQLDVVQSQRDAFGAEAARIKADSDLALARILLRLSAGKPPELPMASAEASAAAAPSASSTPPARAEASPPVPTSPAAPTPTTAPTPAVVPTPPAVPATP